MPRPPRSRPHIARWVPGLILCAILVAATAGLYAAYHKAIAADPLRRALMSMQRGVYVQAAAALMEKPEPDADTMAFRLALRLGMLGASFQLKQEYDAMWTGVGNAKGAQDALQDRSDQMILAITQHNAALQQEAAQFKTLYRRGTALHPPWGRAVIRPRAREAAMIQAMNSLKGGDVSIKYFNVLENGVVEIAVFSTLQSVLQQEGNAALDLGQAFDMPTLLFMVGAKVTDPAIARWYMEEVLALTADDPAHPLRNLTAQELE